MGKSKSSSSKSTSDSSKGEMEIDPRLIRFTHCRIRPYFTGCGKKVEETLDDIIQNRIKVSVLPLITIIPVKNHHDEMIYYSLNNRRLYVLKKLAELGHLEGNVVRVRVKPPLEREKERYTEVRCSLEATIMKEHKPSSSDADSKDVDEDADEDAS